MTCEAVRQLTDAEDYSIRDVTISAALILHDSAATEVLLSMRPVRLTNALDSSWYEFSITSFNGSTWTKHCMGQIRAGTDHPPESSREIVDLPRKINLRSWYQTLRTIGLKYGPTFQHTGRTSAHPHQNRVVAHISNEIPGIKQPENPLHYHPATLDYCFQLYQVAAVRGLGRECRTMAVPTYVQEVYIKRPALDSTFTMEAASKLNAMGGFTSDCVGVDANGDVVMRVVGGKMTSLDDNGENAGVEDPHAGTVLVWKPDIDFQKLDSLIRSVKEERRPYEAIQKLVLLCCIEARDRAKGIEARAVHLKKFHLWINAQATMAELEGYPFVEDAAALSQLSSAQRVSLIERLAEKIQESAVGAAVTAVRRVFDSIEAILDGKADALELLRRDDVLAQLYDLGQTWDYSQFLRHLSHRKPHLRVLEIGAGMGGTTETVLKGLVSKNGEQMFKSYTFTDISPGFFGTAKARFSHIQGMHFQTLGITQDPEKQGFEKNSFDLIVAANVLHATPRLSEALVNAHKLLRPDGKLMLQELCASTKVFNFIVVRLFSAPCRLGSARCIAHNLLTYSFFKGTSSRLVAIGRRATR